MWKLVVLVLVGGCELYTGDDNQALPDAAVVSPVASDSAPCTNKVKAVCGFPPDEPAPSDVAAIKDQWAKDIYAWSKCALYAE